MHMSFRKVSVGRAFLAHFASSANKFDFPCVILCMRIECFRTDLVFVVARRVESSLANNIYIN
jgi:hypothetical protein